MVLKLHVQSPCSAVRGPRVHDGCSGRIPRLKYAAIVKFTSSAPSGSSQIPQSQFAVVSVYGNTIVRSVHVSPLSRERSMTV